MAELLKKDLVKDIILKLHQGLPAGQAKELLLKQVGSITSSEIAEIEQALINEGVPLEEIKKFCNVHTLLFESLLQEGVKTTDSPAHPVYLFKLENREIEKITKSLRELMSRVDEYGIEKFKGQSKNLLEKLKGLEIHYVRKEQLLFPYLEKYGFFGPSKVMWGKHNETRELLKKSLTEFDFIADYQQAAKYIKDSLTPLVDEVEGMIFKEENILFPTALEKLKVEDWINVLKQSEEVGYVFIERPKDILSMVEELKKVSLEEEITINQIAGVTALSLPSGNLTLEELLGLLNILPLDITFVDKNDQVKYFSENKNKIFLRTRSVLGRKVQNCHPPQSVDKVEKILQWFKEGKKDSVDFWINYKGRVVYIRYLAVRNRQGQYLGTLEVTQDITEIKNLTGEKRLLDLD